MSAIDPSASGKIDRLQWLHRLQGPETRGNPEDFAVTIPVTNGNTIGAVVTATKPAETLAISTSVTTVTTVTGQKSKKPEPPSDWWSAADWRAYYNYRVAELINADASLQEARLEAFRATVVHWLNTHWPIRQDGLCAHCSGDESREGLVPFGPAGAGVVWLHHGCWPNWWRCRNKTAKAALAACGIAPPYQ
jgi:hypothetical protein